MPTLNWIGKENVVNHHLDVPFKVLEHKYGFSDGKQSRQETKSGNMVIHGDNLEALKSLLPQYEGKVKCIYIDPPYNTGEEGWKYNDNVNDPRIKKWLGDTVGKEGEDLTRHDKWLCMMYPRLRLLSRLLMEDGLIFISIDDNEVASLKCISNEIFGSKNFEGHIHWRRRSNQPNDKTKLIGLVAEHILVYAKNSQHLKSTGVGKVPLTGKFSNSDNDSRGDWASKPWKVGSGQSGTRYTITSPSGKQFTEDWMGTETFYLELLNDKRIVFPKSEGGLPRKKYFKFEREEEGQCAVNWWGYEIFGSNQNAGKELFDIFGEKTVFDNPKPSVLIKNIIGLSNVGKNDIILDSFAGSGTTGHAVLNLNKEDGGKRKFILVEMMDYADSITAERNKRVITGYGEGNSKMDGTGGAFDYYDVGDPLFKPENELNEKIAIEKIREYIWYTETQSLFEDNKKSNPYYLGINNDTEYYFYYEEDRATTLNYDFLASLPKSAEGFIIYADQCTLPEAYMKKHSIIFKKIPRDITKF